MITFYSTHCPKCKVVEMKLKQKNVDYAEVNDVDEIINIGKEHGIMSAPILKVDDDVYDFSNSVKYLNGLE